MGEPSSGKAGRGEEEAGEEGWKEEGVGEVEVEALAFSFSSA